MSSLHSDLEACVQPLLDENNKDDQLDVKRKHRHTDRDTETQRHRDTETQRHRDTERERETHTHTHTHTHTPKNLQSLADSSPGVIVNC